MAAMTMLALSAAFSTPDAAAYEVKALVTDSVGEPEPFATFRIIDQSDTTRILLGVADEQGSIFREIENSGEYAIHVSAVGKRTATRMFDLGPETPEADLGRIVMMSFGKELGEVTVTALKPVVSREIDRIAYDVQSDEDSKTSQLNEILNKVPLVSVDPDGTIRVKGGTDFKIYKNGRPNKSMQGNAKDIFKSIPASMIKKVEVITDPGAREDAEGSSAILNIVMVENTYTKGVIGNVGLNYNTSSDIPTPNIWLSGQVDKVTLSAYAGMYSNPKRSSESHGRVIADYDQSGDRMVRQQESRGANTGGWGGFEASWEIDTLNLLTAELNAYIGRYKSWTTQDIAMYDSRNNPLYSYRQHQVLDPSQYWDFTGSVNYQHSTRRKGEHFVVSYMVSTTNQTKNDSTYLSDMVNSPVGYTGWKSDNDLNFIEHTGQFDWRRPFGKIHTLEMGMKGIIRRNHSITTQSYTGIGRDSIDYSHQTYVGAVYADYRANVGRWGFRAGLRYELSKLNSEYVDEMHPAYHATLNDVCPNAAISYNINDANSLKIGYSSSINRPGISYLNPAVIYTPLTESHGNPDLKSARNHSLTLNYSFFSRKVSVDLNASFNTTRNGIIETRTIDENNVVHSTFENSGRTSIMTLSFWGMWRPTSKTSLSINGFVRGASYRNDNLGLKGSGFGQRYNLFLNQNLPWKLRLSVGGGMFYFPVQGLYNRSDFCWSSAVYYNMSLMRSFLKEDRLTVRIGAHNPVWAKYNHTSSNTINMPVKWQNDNWTKRVPNYFVSVSYRFGSMNIRVKKTSASINNDDLVGRKN